MKRLLLALFLSLDIQAAVYINSSAEAAGALTNNGSGVLGWLSLSSIGGSGQGASLILTNVTSVSNETYQPIVPANLYIEDFESGVKPTGWTEWIGSSNHLATWDYTAMPLKGSKSIILSNDNPYAIGAFYDIGYDVNEIFVSFLWYCSAIPTNGIVEVLDIYDAAILEEMCDIYVNTSSNLCLALAGDSNKTIPILPGVTNRIWLHYKQFADHGEASLGTSLDDIEPLIGSNYKVATQGSYTTATPIGELLVGPINSNENGTSFVYDRLRVSTLRISDPNNPKFWVTGQGAIVLSNAPSIYSPTLTGSPIATGSLYVNTTSTTSNRVFSLTAGSGVTLTTNGPLLEIAASSSQTPWSSTINAAGNMLTNARSISVTNLVTRGTTTANGDVTLASGNFSTSGGNIVSGAEITAAAVSYFNWAGRSVMYSPSSGVIGLYNGAENNFTRLQFGGTTAVFPALKRTLAGLEIVGADGTANSTNSLTISGALNVTNAVYLGSTLTGTNGMPIRGATNSTAAIALYVGEAVDSKVVVGSAQSLTTSIATNVTSISLTAGDWEVSGNLNTTNGAATVTVTSAGITTTSVTIPTDGTQVYSGSGVSLATVTQLDSLTIPPKQIALSSTTTVYLVGFCTFSAGTVKAFGQIHARRVR